MQSRTINDPNNDLLDLLIERYNWNEVQGTRGQTREFERSDRRMTACVWFKHGEVEFDLAPAAAVAHSLIEDAIARTGVA
jgi:hypothetical protein